MKKFLHYLWIVIKFVLNILKHVLLLPFYCSMPDKYSGVTYNEWLDKDKK